MNMLILWIILIIAFILIDIFTSTFLFVWFALGSIAALILQLTGASITYQVISFCIVSLIAVAAGYPWAKKKFKNIKRTELMEERYIGMEFEAEQDIEDKTRLKLDGSYWTAYNENEGEIIKSGQKFKIERIEGNKIMIKKFKEEEK